MKRAAVFLVLSLACTRCLHAQTTFSTRVLRDSLFIPWELIYGPDNHLWFTQKNGYICRMDTAGLKLDTLYHEAGTVSIKESGMLGMALHPDFLTHPYVYAVWEYQSPLNGLQLRLSRYTWSEALGTLSAPTTLLDTFHGVWYHNGARLAVAGDKLFISIGDGADTANPQNLHRLNGKILRLNLDGTIPDDNPIEGNPIWTWGHRNPQGLVYANGILYSSEHGPDSDDEINIISGGHNYGFPTVLGYCNQPAEAAFCAANDVTEPIMAWTPTIAPCGIDYYDHAMFPSLANSLIMTTLKDQHLWQLRLSAGHNAIVSASVIPGFSYGRLRDLCISPEGKIFVSTSNSNPNDTGAKVDRIVVMYDPEYSYAGVPSVVYPNPSADYISVMVPAPCASLYYRITSVDGRKSGEGHVSCGNPRISIRSLPAGKYYVTVTTDHGKTFTTALLRK